jgi:hypothetical protein
MHQAQCGLAFVLILTSAFNPAQSAEYTVWGVGNRSYGEWTAAHGGSDYPRLNAQTAWLAGYMSAFNNYGALRSGTPRIDFDGMEAWVTIYCGQNPLDIIATAANQLASELLKRER